MSYFACYLYYAEKKIDDIKMAFCEEIKTKEELYETLTLIYDVDEKTAQIIIDNLTNRHRLSESEEILLESHGIEKDFIESIQNNKNLNGYNTEELNIALVGPFFYITILFLILIILIVLESMEIMVIIQEVESSMIRQKMNLLSIWINPS